VVIPLAITIVGDDDVVCVYDLCICLFTSNDAGQAEIIVDRFRSS
jgi:hypothetical protein